MSVDRVALLLQDHASRPRRVRGRIQRRERLSREVGRVGAVAAAEGLVVLAEQDIDGAGVGCGRLERGHDGKELADGVRLALVVELSEHCKRKHGLARDW